MHILEAKRPDKNPRKRETVPVVTEISTIFAEMKFWADGVSDVTVTTKMECV